MCYLMRLALLVTSVSSMRIACVGDSITEGSGASEDMDYPAQLQRLVGDAHLVHNFGKSGHTMSLSDRWYRDSDEFKDSLKAAADVYIVKLGTNDAKDDNWVSKKGESAVDRYWRYYEEMVEILRDLPSSPVVIVATAPPQLEPTEKWLEWSPSVINDVLPGEVRDIADDLDAPLMDLYAAFRDHQGSLSKMFNDPIHPSDDGYALIAEEAQKVLAKLFTGEGFSETTYEPSYAPTPTRRPTVSPTVAPTPRPSAKPSAKPSAQPSAKPSAKPSLSPTGLPTPRPSASPSLAPTPAPPTIQAPPSLAPTTTQAPTTLAPTTLAPTTLVPTPPPTPRPTPKQTRYPTNNPGDEQMAVVVLSAAMVLDGVVPEDLASVEAQSAFVETLIAVDAIRPEDRVENILAERYESSRRRLLIGDSTIVTFDVVKEELLTVDAAISEFSEHIKDSIEDGSYSKALEDYYLWKPVVLNEGASLAELDECVAVIVYQDPEATDSYSLDGGTGISGERASGNDEATRMKLMFAAMFALCLLCGLACTGYFCCCKRRPKEAGEDKGSDESVPPPPPSPETEEEEKKRRKVNKFSKATYSPGRSRAPLLYYDSPVKTRPDSLASLEEEEDEEEMKEQPDIERQGSLSSLYVQQSVEEEHDDLISGSTTLEDNKEQGRSRPLTAMVRMLSFEKKKQGIEEEEEEEDQNEDVTVVMPSEKEQGELDTVDLHFSGRRWRSKTSQDAQQKQATTAPAPPSESFGEAIVRRLTRRASNMRPRAGSTCSSDSYSSSNEAASPRNSPPSPEKFSSPLENFLEDQFYGEGEAPPPPPPHSRIDDLFSSPPPSPTSPSRWRTSWGEFGFGTPTRISESRTSDTSSPGGWLSSGLSALSNASPLQGIGSRKRPVVNDHLTAVEEHPAKNFLEDDNYKRSTDAANDQAAAATLDRAC